MADGSWPPAVAEALVGLLLRCDLPTFRYRDAARSTKYDRTCLTSGCSRSMCWVYAVRHLRTKDPGKCDAATRRHRPRGVGEAGQVPGVR